MSDAPVTMSRGLPETVLPAMPAHFDAELAAALAIHDATARRAALREVAARHPRHLGAWAALATSAEHPAEAYAYARVGYHRGLDALRGAGWRGTGYVRYAEPTNRGFLESLEALHGAARAIGEEDEEERCRVFLIQLDPSWTDWERAGEA